MTENTSTVYPLGIHAHAQHDVIGAVELTPNGKNTAIRIGRLLPSGGWQQHSYVVLTPEEVTALAAALGFDPPETDHQAAALRDELLATAEAEEAAGHTTQAAKLYERADDLRA